MKKLFDVAIVGANTAYGEGVLKALFMRDFPIGKLALFCGDSATTNGTVNNMDSHAADGETSNNSKTDNGEKKIELSFNGKDYDLLTLSGENVIKNRVDFAFFCSSSEVSKKYAPLFSALGCTVIDCSSAFKLEENVPLVLASVNPKNALINSGIICCPNSPVAIALSVIAPLYKKYGVKRLIVCTYQPFVDKIVCDNVIPIVGQILPSGYTTAEQELINETRKILNDNELSISATCVSLPVCHGEAVAVNIELGYSVSPDDVLRVLSDSGICVAECPTLLDVCGKGEVYAGRIRRDFSHQNSFNLWLVGDNILCAVALNMVDIAMLLI